MAKIANVALTNTFDTWRTRSNQSFDRLSQFAINNSSLYANTLTANVSFTSKGAAALQSTATVTGLLTASGRATVGTNLTVSGNTTLGGLATITTANAVFSGSTANPLVRITQTGSGHALIVEDSTSPDSSPFVIDPVGRIITGSTTSRTTVSLIAPQLQIHALDNNQSTFGMTDWQATGFGGPFVVFAKSKGGAVGTRGILSNNERLGIVQWAGDDGVAFIPAAAITAAVDGTPGLDDMPGRLVFSTTADGAATVTERMRIDNAGRVGIGGTPAAGRTLEILQNISGSTIGIGVRAAGTISSDVTSEVRYFTTSAATQAASFTVSNLRHYYATQGTFGAGSTVTQQLGFHAESTLIGATNNFGFRGDIAAGTGRWNFYAGGTADNYFAGNVGIGTTTPAATLDVVGTVSTARADILSQTLTDGATISWNTALGQIATVTLAGNRTMAAPTNLKVGTYILNVIQDGTGSRTITWNSVFKWTAATAPPLTTAANRRDVFSFFSDGTNLYGSFLPDVR